MTRFTRKGLVALAALAAGLLLALGPAAGQARPDYGTGKDCRHALYSAAGSVYHFGKQRYIRTDWVQNVPPGVVQGEIRLARGVVLCRPGYIRPNYTKPGWITSRAVVWDLKRHKVTKTYRFFPTGRRGVYRTKRFRPPFDDPTRPPRYSLVLEAVGRFRPKK